MYWDPPLSGVVRCAATPATAAAWPYQSPRNVRSQWADGAAGRTFASWRGASRMTARVAVAQTPGLAASGRAGQDEHPVTVPHAVLARGAELTAPAAGERRAHDRRGPSVGGVIPP